MADGGGHQHQRAFTNRIKPQSAQQIRQSTTATVKAAAEKNRPKLHIVDPLDYEGELISRRKDLEREKYLNLLLFPQQDISVSEEEQKHRTRVSSVPSEATSQSAGLLTDECLKLYTSKWHRVNYIYSNYSSSYDKLIDPDYRFNLPEETFELDLVYQEKLKQLETDCPGTPLSHSGYLHKGPFPQDGGISVSMKYYRKRWFVLTGCPSEGGYMLIYYKDEKSSNIKGKINLDTCTEIRPNTRYKPFGFDLCTEDERIFYPLATDNEGDMKDWITTLERAIKQESEETDAGDIRTLSSFYTKDTLKDTRKIDISQNMLEHSPTIDAANAKAREKEKRQLFSAYPELMTPLMSVSSCSGSALEGERSLAPVPEERFGLKFIVKCHSLQFKLSVERNGVQDNIEPFFVTLAVYDANKRLKISEDFHVDLNSPSLRQLVPPLDGNTADGPHPLSQKATRASEAIFSVTIPHQEVYLVARIEKVLQDGINACTEPYIKAPGDNVKTLQKLTQQVGPVCSRLGQYRMPFAWAVRPLFTEGETLDTSTEFSNLYKQEGSKLMDEDILKVLSDYRNIHKHKLQVIPGSLNIEVLSVVPVTSSKSILTPSLLPLKSSSDMVNGDIDGGVANTVPSSPRISSPILEVREFPPLDAYPSASYHYYPHLSYTHHLYVYPISLKYDGQKSFAKARNIACCVQFKESDDKGASPLPVIYSKCSTATFTDRANAAVIHHSTTPTFYEEVKIKLPVKLSPNHHVLFTFFHVGCNIQKAAKTMKSSTKTVVGYAWLPLTDSKGRVSAGSQILPVSTSLPNFYLTSNPEIKWVDNQKQLFTVTLKLDSTICTQDVKLYKFFQQCSGIDRGTSQQPPTMTELLAAIKVLEDISLPSIIHFLPLIFAQLFKLLSSSNKEVENIKTDMLRLLISLVGKVMETHGTQLLQSYIDHMFVTVVNSSNTNAVHDELARLLYQYLRTQSSSDQGTTQQIFILLEHLWFFLELMLKSMAQYLFMTKKIQASRKNRYPEDFGWNLQSLITSLLTHIRDNHNNISAKKANKSIAEFVKHSFSFLDRGVVFKIIARYLDAFSVKENAQLSRIKLEFLKIVCDHEHFIALNLPFVISADNMDFTLSDDFCRKHFLIGLLLREVESALNFEAGVVRRKTFEILRNLLAKHDCDDRYSEPGQRARIALLYFPLISLVLGHIDRLNTSCTPYVSPMLNATSMAFFNDSRSMASSTTGTLRSVTSEKERSIDASRPKQTSTHYNIESELSLGDVSELLSRVARAPSPSPMMEQSIVDMDKLSVDETRDLLMCVMFVLKHLDRAVLQHWWRECMGSSTSSTLWSSLNDTIPSQFTDLLDFFDLLESCLYTFRYVGRSAIAIKMSSKKTRETDRQLLTSLGSLSAAPPPPIGKSKKHITTSGSIIASSPSSSLQLVKGKPSRSAAVASVTSSLQSTLQSSFHDPLSSLTLSSVELDVRVNMEAALAKEVGLILLNMLDIFGTSFRRELSQDDGDNILMSKFFSLLVSFLQVNQSVSLQTHIFALLRAFTFQFRGTLYKGSPDYCGVLCYEVLQCCNSKISSTRAEATVLLYLIMRGNFEFFKGQRGFARSHIQATIAVSKLVSNLLGQNDADLRKSLTTISKFVYQDERVQGTQFPIEVGELMMRLKTVLSSTAQMKIHQNDHEKLVDLHYSLANSYVTSPELRQTWLDSMVTLHLSYGNYSEAAQCCIHIAGLVAEYLKMRGKYAQGCSTFRHITPNIERDESDIKEDNETADELTFTERNLIYLLETSIQYFEQAERYEMMSEVFKLLQPFYEQAKDFRKMTEMYGKLHSAYRKVVDVMTTGRRYLGTYFRIAFYGKPFGDDNEKQFVYKEPKVTTLAELTLRLQKLYSRKFGSPDIVHIIQESKKVDVSSLNSEHAYVQITHVEPFFTSDELEERKTKFERENNISRFVFETPFTLDGRPPGDVTKQCMRKTILTTTHWFPYVKKRILIIDTEQFELSAIEVATEAMEKKIADMRAVVKMNPPDLKRLQLLLQGCISTQVNQGVQEYTLFLTEPHLQDQQVKHVERLKEVYRVFMQVCQEALELNATLISTDQLLYHDELKNKYQQMQSKLLPLLNTEEEDDDDEHPRSLSPTLSEASYSSRRRAVTNSVDPHRMSAILFSSISSSK